jgi:hypothetical protein
MSDVRAASRYIHSDRCADATFVLRSASHAHIAALRTTDFSSAARLEIIICSLLPPPPHPPGVSVAAAGVTGVFCAPPGVSDAAAVSSLGLLRGRMSVSKSTQRELSSADIVWALTIVDDQHVSACNQPNNTRDSSGYTR